MNNDKITAPFVGCSPVAALPNNNAAAAAAIAAAGVTLNGNDTDSPFTSVAGHSTTTISTTSPSIYTSASAPKLAVAPTSGQTDDKTKKSETWEQTKLNRLDDNGFKHLLDEVVSYKNPRDKENTSDIYRKLLQETNKKQKAQKQASRALTSRYPTRSSASNSHKQGGSLQDLVESVRNESLDVDYSSGGPRLRRHNHNSRPKKYSSVSSRQREGGSLPSNVNVSNCNLSVYEQPFMNEEKNKQRWCKNEQPRLVSNTTANTPTCLAATAGGTLPVSSSTGSSIGTEVCDTTTAPVCSRVPAEISITTHACTAPHKNNLGIGNGCGRPEGSLINPITLQATINGARSSATCAALASAIAIVSENACPMDEMNETCIDSRNDLISQGFQFGRIEGIEMKIPRANIIGSVLTRSDFSPNNNNSNNGTCYVDEAVHFTTLDRGKRSVDARYIPLDENYKACKSVLGEKSELVKMQSIATKPISKQFDENENTLNTTYTTSQSQAKAKKKKSQSERNTKTLDVQSVEGYRGSDPIEVLVKYIESSKDTKQNDKVAKFTENNNKKKDKKKDKEKERDRDRDKDKSKIKRSNSLEELRSCSKLDGDDVTMRTKTTVKNKNLENKDKQTIIAGNTGTNRKNERRSWGTEELTYLGENNAIEEVREKAKDKEKKKSKEKDIDFTEKLEKVVEKRKKSEANLVVSIESIPCESAEFHIVTKKKKPKKQRQPAEEGRNNGLEKTQKNTIYQNRKYQTNFSNDRETYISTFNNNNGNDKSRRKSTSSMPPSEKSDSSDLDSVHSLPIESAGKRTPHQVHHHHQNQPRSYAEIARKTEAKNVVSPGGGATGIIESTASNTSSNNSSHTELEVNLAAVPQASTATKKSKKSIKTDFPELIFNDGGGTSCSSTTSSTSTIVKQISYSQSLTSANKTDETAVIGTENLPPKIQSMDIVKHAEKNASPQPQVQQMPLQKSKSVETDGFYNSIDQYPALEKTVKRHSTTNAGGSEIVILPVAPVLGSLPAPLNSINTLSCTPMEDPAPLSKKSKSNTKVNEEVLIEHQIQAQAQQHLQQQYPTSRKKKEKTSETFSPFTQPTSFAAASNNINSRTKINHNHHNYSYNNHKSSCINSHNINSNNNNSNKFSNRPAVIILNDDTTAGGLSSCIGNEFTFGDFNEEELRLFDDSQPQQQHQQEQQPPPQPPLPELSQKRCSTSMVSSFDDSGGNFNTTSGSTASDIANNSDDTMLLMHHTSSPNSSLIIDQSSDSGICNNYDRTKVKRNSNQQTTGTTSVPTSRSFPTQDVVRNNPITSPFKESLASSSSSSSSSSASSASSSSSTYVANVAVSISATPSANTNKTSKSITTSTSSPYCTQQQQHIQLDSSKAKAAPPSSTRLSTINKRNSQQQSITTSLPSQQLETCDDIETAIIAAAKKAAAVATEQTTTSVINKNNTKSSFNLPPAMGSTIKENNVNNNNINQYNSYSFRQGITSPPSTGTLHSKTKEYARRGGAAADAGVMGQQQRKEIDVHFIPPTKATPISSIQNNETIINFIGSAWEEVSNSKVTQFYDGQ